MLFRLIKRAPWIVLGAAIAWFADPMNGATRRKEARQRLEELSGGAPPMLEDREPSLESSPIARAS
jgi:hypothetical protein